MPITFSNGGVYAVTINGLWNGTNVMNNVFHLQLVDGGVLSEADGLADIEAWLTEIYDYLSTITADNMVWSTFRVDALEGTNTSGTVPLTAPIAGALTGDLVPPQVALLSYFPTGVRRRQLRKYWSGWDDSAIGVNGGFSSAIATGVTTNLANLFLLIYEGTNGSWLYGHYRTGEPSSFIGATSMITTGNPVIQRRRRVGHGV